MNSLDNFPIFLFYLSIDTKKKHYLETECEINK